MYQNFNCCSSDWMERTKYIQGRSGTKSKDCLPFVQYYKCLENKIENENIQHLHLCSAFPAHISLGNSFQHSIFFPPSQDPPNPSHLVKSFVQGLPYRTDCPVVISRVFFSFFNPQWGWEESRITFKIKTTWRLKCGGRNYMMLFFPAAGDLPVLLIQLLCLNFIALNFVSPNKKLQEAQFNTRI